MRDHYRVCSVLMDLDNQQIVQVGLALGMNYAKLRRMSSLPGDMVAAWLRREDDVLEVSGAPTWKTLSEALKDTGQTGLALKIKQQYQCDPSVGNQTQVVAQQSQPTITTQTSRLQGKRATCTCIESNRGQLAVQESWL